LDFDAEPAAYNLYDNSLSMESLIGEMNQLKEKLNQLQSGNYLQSNVNLVSPNFNQASAQEKPVQTLRGLTIDKSIKTVLSGANIELIGGVNKQTISNNEGAFKFDFIPVGRYSVRISYIGYKTITIPNIAIESGKETLLSVEMEEDINKNKEVIVKSGQNKTRPINDAALVSGRMFSVEETRRFAAGINDPSRIATSFPGVSNTGDNNALSIRGNAPNGLLWRMEGAEISNPNHFAGVGTSGGAISILSAQLLANSDFLTGAFPSEFGNALSGVFDINLRKGNKSVEESGFKMSKKPFVPSVFSFVVNDEVESIWDSFKSSFV
jgi:hypothetical protein